MHFSWQDVQGPGFQTHQCGWKHLVRHSCPVWTCAAVGLGSEVTNDIEMMLNVETCVCARGEPPFHVNGMNRVECCVVIVETTSLHSIIDSFSEMRFPHTWRTMHNANFGKAILWLGVIEQCGTTRVKEFQLLMS